MFGQIDKKQMPMHGKDATLANGFQLQRQMRNFWESLQKSRDHTTEEKRQRKAKSQLCHLLDKDLG